MARNTGSWLLMCSARRGGRREILGTPVSDVLSTMMNYLALVITFSVAGIAAATTGSLLYVAMDDVAAQTIGVFRL